MVLRQCLTARGGMAGGNGGSAEISSRGGLAENGIVDLSAAQGKTGLLLLDPTTITITTAAGNPLPSNTVLFTDPPTNLTITDSAIVAANANIDLQATQSITTSGAVNVVLTGANTLTLETKNDTAAGVIDLSSAATFGTSGGNITISASESGSNAGNITLGVLTSSGGNMTISTGNGTIAVNGAVNAGAGTVTLSATAGITETGKITAGAVGVTNTTAGDVTLVKINAVDAFSGSNTVGNITFKDGVIALTINNVDTSASSKDISITNFSDRLAVNGTVSAGTGNVTLLCHTSGMSETGTITAGAVECSLTLRSAM